MILNQNPIGQYLSRCIFDGIVLNSCKDSIIAAKCVYSVLGILYQRFLGWANEFDTASTEQKKMIICALCNRIEVSRDYEVKIVIDMDYEQFCK